MKAIVIDEEDCGEIGIAANYYYAIEFLIQKDWLNGNTEVWVNHHGFLLKEVFEDWRKEIHSWDSIEKFNNFFYHIFELREVEVYGVNYWG